MPQEIMVAIAPTMSTNNLALIHCNHSQWGLANNAYLWNLATERIVTTVQNPTSVTLSLDGQHLIGAFQDGSLQMIDATNGNIIHTIQTDHTFPIDGIIINANNQFFITTSQDAIHVWDMATKTRKYSLPAGRVSTIAISPDSRYIAIGYDNPLSGTVRLYNTANGQQLSNPVTGQFIPTLTGHFSRIGSINITDDSNDIITSSWDGSARLWSAQSGTLLKTFKFAKPLISAVIDENNKNLITLSFENLTPPFVLSVFDIETETIKYTMENVLTFKMSADRKYMIVGLSNGSTRIYNVDTGIMIQEMYGDDTFPIAISPDDRFFMTGSTTIRVWKPKPLPRLLQEKQKEE